MDKKKDKKGNIITRFLSRNKEADKDADSNCKTQAISSAPSINTTKAVLSKITPKRKSKSPPPLESSDRLYIRARDPNRRHPSSRTRAASVSAKRGILKHRAPHGSCGNLLDEPNDSSTPSYLRPTTSSQTRDFVTSVKKSTLIKDPVALNSHELDSRPRSAPRSSFPLRPLTTPKTKSNVKRTPEVKKSVVIEDPAVSNSHELNQRPRSAPRSSFPLRPTLTPKTQSNVKRTAEKKSVVIEDPAVSNSHELNRRPRSAPRSSFPLRPLTTPKTKSNVKRTTEEKQSVGIEVLDRSPVRAPRSQYLLSPSIVPKTQSNIVRRTLEDNTRESNTKDAATNEELTTSSTCDTPVLGKNREQSFDKAICYIKFLKNHPELQSKMDAINNLLTTFDDYEEFDENVNQF